MEQGIDSTGEVLDALRRHPAFAALRADALDGILGSLRWLELEAGSMLLQRASPALDAYLVQRGTLTVEIGDGQSAATLQAGDLVGEIAVLAGGTRTADVRAKTDARLLVIPASTLRSLAQDPEVWEHLVTETGERLRHTRLLDQLNRLFGPVDPDLVRHISSSLEWIRLRAGSVLFEQGDPADSAYFVVGGRLRVAVRDDEGEETVVADVGSGELIGEMGLLDESPRNATIWAARDSELVRFPRRVFETLVVRYPLVMYEVARTVLRRTRVPSGGRTEAPQTSVVLIPHGNVDLGPLCEQLTEELGRFGSSQHLWPEKVDAILGLAGAAHAAAADPESGRLVQLLHELADQHRFTVLQGSAIADEWTKRAARQADQVVVVADAGSGETEGLADWLRSLMVSERYPKILLALVHRAGTSEPSGTRNWLDAFAFESHVHLRKGSPEDVSHLARILAGEAVSLVLSGGGARGFAHLGAIRALHEAGVPIDFVAGTSIGSVMASLVAMRLPLEEQVPLIAKQFARLLDYTLPFVSVMSGRRVTRAMVEAYGERRIEDLWRPFFCVSTSLTTAKLHVHRSGRLVHALRASTAIPGVFPPVPSDGELLVDGGVLNNLPIDVMRRINPSGTIIAVDVAPPVGPRAKEDFGLHVSGWRILGARLRPGAGPNLPGIANTLLRSTLVGAMRERDRMVRDAMADLYLDLDLRGWGLLAFDAVPDVAEKGYELAAGRIDEWLETRPLRFL